MSGHLDGPPPGPPDPPYIPGDLGAPSAEEFARRRASSEPRPANPTPEERVRDGSHLPGGYRTLYVPTSVALRAVADARDDERRRIRGLVANRAADLLVTDSPLGSALADLWKDLIDLDSPVAPASPDNPETGDTTDA